MSVESNTAVDHDAAEVSEPRPACRICKGPMPENASDGRTVCDVCLGIVSIPEIGLLRRCPHCKEIFPLDADHFYHDSRAKSGFKSWCKHCESSRQSKAKWDLRQRNKKLKDRLSGFVGPVTVVPASDPCAEQTAPVSGIVIDLAPFPEVLDYFTQQARDQERTIEGQIRWVLRGFVANIKP